MLSTGMYGALATAKMHEIGESMQIVPKPSPSAPHAPLKLTTAEDRRTAGIDVCDCSESSRSPPPGGCGCAGFLMRALQNSHLQSPAAWRRKGTQGERSGAA